MCINCKTESSTWVSWTWLDQYFNSNVSWIFNLFSMKQKWFILLTWNIRFKVFRCSFVFVFFVLFYQKVALTYGSEVPHISVAGKSLAWMTLIESVKLGFIVNGTNQSKTQWWHHLKNTKWHIVRDLKNSVNLKLLLLIDQNCIQCFDL